MAGRLITDKIVRIALGFRYGKKKGPGIHNERRID